MRLIDADAFIEKIDKDKFTHIRNDYQSGHNDGIFHAKIVADNFPIVDAIPVEWIRKYTEENRLYQSDDFDFYISDMIADWMERKEE